MGSVYYSLGHQQVQWVDFFIFVLSIVIPLWKIYFSDHMRRRFFNKTVDFVKVYTSEVVSSRKKKYLKHQWVI